MDLAILQETKTTDKIYTCGSDEYRVFDTDAPSQHHGGVAVFYRAHCISQWRTSINLYLTFSDFSWQ